MPSANCNAWVYSRWLYGAQATRSQTIRLQQLQTQLQYIYELDVMHNVNDFLITDRKLADSLESTQAPRNNREKLLVQQSGEELHLSLYLDDDVVKNLQRQDPQTGLHGGNLQDFCLALEGISHFLYLIWNASYQRNVTMLEMELQAEIDKFVMLTLNLEQQKTKPYPGQLRQLLFESICFHRDLVGPELIRYRDANLYAEKYCRYLEKRFFSSSREYGLINELRRFYRLNRSSKLRLINNLY